MIRILFALSLFLLPASKAWACSCAGPDSPEKAYHDAKGVFSAHVSEIRKNPQGHAEEIVLTVDRTWKTVLDKTFTIKSPRHMCAYWNFEEGKSYLIYAQHSRDKENPDGYEVTICSRTKKLEQAQIETRYLDAIIAGKDTASIDKTLPELLIKAEDPHMRAEAAAILGWMMRPQAGSLPEGTVAALVQATKDASPVVRVAAARNLGNFNLGGKPGVKQALLALLRDSDRDARAAAVGALAMAGRRDSAVFRGLAEALKFERQGKPEDAKRHEGVLASFARSLEEAAATDEDKAEAVDLLYSLIDEVQDPYNKVSVIQNLGFHNERARKAAPKLLAVLKSADSYHVKQYTIAALGDIRAAGMQAEIEPYLKDENCYVARSVVEAVHKMNPEGFPAFFSEKAMPEIQARFDKCSAEFVWGLQSIGPDAREIEPFLKEKYAAMPDGDWKKDTLKTLLETWAKAEKQPAPANPSAAP